MFDCLKIGEEFLFFYFFLRQGYRSGEYLSIYNSYQYQKGNRIMISINNFCFKILLFCCFVINIDAADIRILDNDISDMNGKNVDLLIKVKEGVLTMLSSEEIQDVVSIVFIKGNRNESVLMDTWQKPWTDDNIVLVEDAFNQYMNSYGVVVSSDKKDLILNHLQRFAAFKAAVFSSYPPCKELAQVISSQIAQGIRWVNRNEYVYPSEEKRSQAKNQIREFFNFLENYLVSLSPSPQINELIKKEISIKEDRYMWKVDSPFFVHGKKVIDSGAYQSIINECMVISKTYFSETELNIPDTLPPFIKEKQLNSLVRRIVSLSKNPLLKAYGEGMAVFSYPEEIEENKNLIESIRLNLLESAGNKN
jgi:hypothetical protein